jgi:hypothetical protein
VARLGLYVLACPGTSVHVTSRTATTSPEPPGARVAAQGTEYVTR